ncbi:unnamed protein product, partial [Prorocentrum cordatum]
AESWGAISKATEAKLQRALVSGCRVATKSPHSAMALERKTNDWAFCEVPWCGFKDVLRFRRLKYIARLMVHGPPVLQRLLDLTIDMTSSWAQFMQQDLEWLRNFADAGRGEDTLSYDEFQEIGNAWVTKRVQHMLDKSVQQAGGAAQGGIAYLCYERGK